jgi:hypothetical protein
MNKEVIAVPHMIMNYEKRGGRNNENINQKHSTSQSSGPVEQ